MRHNTITPAQAKQLAAILRRHRLQLDLSMRKAALQAGINIATIVSLESGTNLAPQPSTLKAVAEALAIDLNQLYTTLNWLPAQPLPNLAPYMRAKYRDLPETAITEVEAFIADLRAKHHLIGPADGEDEQP